MDTMECRNCPGLKIRVWQDLLRRSDLRLCSAAPDTSCKQPVVVVVIVVIVCECSATTAALRWASGNPVAAPRVAPQDWEALDLATHDPVALENKREAMSQLMVRVRGQLGEETVRKPLEQVLTPPQLEVHSFRCRVHLYIPHNYSVARMCTRSRARS